MEEKVRRNWSGDALFMDRVELLALERGLETERTSPESVVIVFPSGINYQAVEAEIMDRASEPFHQSVFVLRSETVKPPEQILPDVRPEGSTGSTLKTIERLQGELAELKLEVERLTLRGDAIEVGTGDGWCTHCERSAFGVGFLPKPSHDADCPVTIYRFFLKDHKMVDPTWKSLTDDDEDRGVD